MKTLWSHRWVIVGVFASFLAMSVESARAGLTLANLFSFDGFTNGGDPRPRLVEYTNGLFYGTTSGGGTYDKGTVFTISPEGAFNLLVTVDGTNGSEPYGGVMLAKDGNFYGTTMNGGISNMGTIFRMTPDGAMNVLVSFVGTNGKSPSSGLIQGKDGNIYGVSEFGGDYGFGTAFGMTLSGELTVLTSFSQTNLDPMSGLFEASDGNFYGTTRLGGAAGAGSVYRLTPSGVLTTIASFYGTNGYWPAAGVIQASDGYLYGTTIGTLAGTAGTVFRISTNGELTTLITFQGITDPNGSSPLADLIQASDGNLYGTTVYGGAHGVGTVFQITADGTFNTIYSFSGTNDGVNPRAALLQASDGNLYGETSAGGYRRDGNIFRLSVPMAPVLEPPLVRDGVVTLNWKAIVGQMYQVEYSTSEDFGRWNVLVSGLNATNGTMSVRDAGVAGSQRFYRVGLVP